MTSLESGGSEASTSIPTRTVSPKISTENTSFLPPYSGRRSKLSSTSSIESTRFNYVCETMLIDGVLSTNETQQMRRSTSSIFRPSTSHAQAPAYITRNSSVSRISLAPSIGEIMASLPLRNSSFNGEMSNLTNKRSTRHSFGKEWTKNHWDKMKGLEQTSSQAKKCSKLSSGFAPLMIFGGLVFVCIGVSANFNSQSKDHEKLQRLSVAPLAMGSFMLMLGTILMCTWFGCRTRARAIDQKVLHGSREFLNEENLLQTLFAKIYGNNNPKLDEVFSPQVIIGRYSDEKSQIAAAAAASTAITSDVTNSRGEEQP